LRSKFQNLADRAALWLTIIAIGAGSVTLVTWLLIGFEFNFALVRTVTVLVMACPHALELAAGVAYGFGILLTPAVGAVFMSASTVIVAINAMLMRRAKLS